jgi:hypothetical protein
MKNSTCFKVLSKVLAPIRPILGSNKNTLNGLNTLLILVLAVAFLGQKKALEPVVFSKGIAIASFAKELNDKGVSDVKQRLLVNRFVSALPKALEQYSKIHRVVVLNDKEVVAGAPNITPYVLAYIATEMTQQNQGNKSHG